MSKVTITIDDAKPELVAAFGADALNTIADEFGYMEMVEKTAEELPPMEDVTITDPGTGEPVTVQKYQEGTEMFKPNPQTRAEFVAQRMLTQHIVPALVRNLGDRKRKEALAQVESEVKQAAEVIKSVAEVVTA